MVLDLSFYGIIMTVTTTANYDAKNLPGPISPVYVIEFEDEDDQFADFPVVVNPLPSEDNLVLYYKLDETTGATAADSSGNGDDGTLVNFPGDDSEWVTAQTNNGLEFDGTDSRVSGPNPETYLQSGLSLGWWFKANSVATSTYFFCVRMYDAVDGWSYLYITHSASTDAELTINYSAAGNSTQLQTNESGALWTDNDITAAWQYALITIEDGDYIKAYLNGTLATAAASPLDGDMSGITMADFNLPVAGSPQLVLGNYASHNGSAWSYGGASSVFDGIMDEVRIYDTVVTPAEALGLYNNDA